MLIGYCRISSTDQNLDLQRDALVKAGCGKIFEDKLSGVNNDRPGLTDAIEFIREGDTLVVWRLDRLGRTLLNLIKLINELNTKKAGFKSLQDCIDTQTSTGIFFFHIIGAFAELERNLIVERTLAGLTAARARGRSGGRPRAFSDDTFQMAFKLWQDKTRPVGEICKKLNLNKRTFYTHLKKQRWSQTANDLQISKL